LYESAVIQVGKHVKASTYHVVVASVKFVLLFDEEETIYEPLMFVYIN